ncbi:MAG: hypothetical protein AAFQ68_25760, partial [Bacteroidota bacterium]
MWDLRFNYSISDSIHPTDNLGLAAVAFNGSEYWVAEWNTNVFHRLDINASLLQSFTIPDLQGFAIVGTRGITWDGQYFYLCNNSNSIYQVDPNNRQTIAEINAPDIVRTITYQADNDRFWISNWGPPGPEDGPLIQIDRQGNSLRQIPATTHQLSSCYGLAYDGLSPGGPYLWAMDQSGSGASIVLIDLAQGTPRGTARDVNLDLNTFGAAGGLFIAEQHPLFPGQRILGGLVQEDPDILFGLELDYQQIQVDARILQAGTEGGYSILPLAQTDSLMIPINVVNQGVLNIDSISILLDAKRDGMDEFRQIRTFAGPDAQDSSQYQLGPWLPQEAGTFAFRVAVNTTSQVDEDTSNNETNFSLVVSDSIYARDFGAVSGSLGIGAGPGQGSILGQIYRLRRTDFMTSVSFYLESPPEGDQVFASVYNLDSLGKPDFLLANTVSHTLTEEEAENGVWLTLPFLNGPLGMPEGEYFVGLNETNSNLGIGTNDEGFSEESTWVYWASSPAGDWARNEDFGFLTTYIIRPNFGPCAPIYLNGSIETIDGEPNSLKVVPQGGKSPYAYQWDDPLAQNTAIATNLTAGRAYTVQIEDDNGCIKTITSNVLGDDPTNIEIPFLSSWQLFPNPTDGLISWEADWQKPVSGNWRLLSIEGKVLQEDKNGISMFVV